MARCSVLEPLPHYWGTQRLFLKPIQRAPPHLHASIDPGLLHGASLRPATCLLIFLPPQKTKWNRVMYPFFKKDYFFYVDHFLKPLLNLLQYCFLFLFFAFIGCKAYGILGFEPASPLLEDKILTTGLPGKSPFYQFLKNYFSRTSHKRPK